MATKNKKGKSKFVSFPCKRYCFARNEDGECTILTEPTDNPDCPFYKTPQQAAEDRKHAAKLNKERGIKKK